MWCNNTVGDISYGSAADSASEPSREWLRGSKHSLTASQTPKEPRRTTRDASREAARKPLCSGSSADNGGKQSSGSPPRKTEWKGRGGSGWNKGLRRRDKSLPFTAENAVPKREGKPRGNKGLRLEQQGLPLTAENAVMAAAAVLERPAKASAAKAQKAASPAAQQGPEEAEPMQLQLGRAHSMVQGESTGPSANAPSAGPQESLPPAGKAFKRCCGIHSW